MTCEVSPALPPSVPQSAYRPAPGQGEKASHPSLTTEKCSQAMRGGGEWGRMGPPGGLSVGVDGSRGSRGPRVLSTHD